MNNRDGLIAAIQNGLYSGTINSQDLMALAGQTTPAAQPLQNKNRVTPTAVLNYVASGALIAASLTLLAQFDQNEPVAGPIPVALMLGIAGWVVAFFIGHRQKNAEWLSQQTAALLFGSVFIWVTFAYCAALLSDSVTGSEAIIGAIGLAILGALHLLYDQICRRSILLAFGLIATTSAIPATLAAIVPEIFESENAVAVATIVTSALLMVAGRLAVAIIRPADGLVAFLDWFGLAGIFVTMFFMGFTDSGPFWLAVLVLASTTVLIVSALQQLRSSTALAGVFLGMAVISVATQFFDGLAQTLIYIIAALGVLAIAFFAQSLSKPRAQTMQPPLQQMPMPVGQPVYQQAPVQQAPMQQAPMQAQPVEQQPMQVFTPTQDQQNQPPQAPQ